MSQAAHGHDRLAREVEHFDAHYQHEAAQGITPLSDFDKARYAATPADTIYPREFFYHLLAPLRDKDTLEIACGNGIDANISAHNGANVHAYDVSAKSVELVRRRAEINGLTSRISLETTGDFLSAFKGQTFDAITGYAALHHLPWRELSQQVYDRLRPGGIAVFAEPVVNSSALAWVRKQIPIRVAEVTEDELPMTDADIAEFAQPFDRMVRREFQCLSRIWPLFPNCWSLAVALHRLDHWLMKVPFMRRFATVVVFGLYRDR